MISVNSVLVGLILMLIVILSVLAVMKAFSVPPLSPVYSGCNGPDYLSIQDTIAIQNVSIQSHLTVDSQGRLLFSRVALPTSGCVPGPEQEQIIEFPQQCAFMLNGQSHIYAYSAAPAIPATLGSANASVLYTYADSLNSIQRPAAYPWKIMAGANCKPESQIGGTIQTTGGTPVPNWVSPSTIVYAGQ